MKREKKFTPGPWVAEIDIDKDNRVTSENIDDGSATVCFMNGHWVRDTREIANANLIAAAPELLKELESHCEACRQRNPDFSGKCPACLTHRAIAKAYGEGETP
jgi:hypothetical protein